MTTTDDRIDTRHAAALYGCTSRHLVHAMAEEGVEPEVRKMPMKHGGASTHYFWHPAEVLMVRAERKLRVAEARTRFLLMVQDRKGVASTGSRLKAKATLQETNRLKILQRVAKRTGTTVEILCIDKGLEAWYRSLPPKHRRHDEHGK